MILFMEAWHVKKMSHYSIGMQISVSL